jgi:hypothetical protein
MTDSNRTPSRDDLLAAYLATRGATKCKPAKGRGRPVRRLVRENEARLAREFRAREQAERNAA